MGLAAEKLGASVSPSKPQTSERRGLQKLLNTSVPTFIFATVGYAGSGTSFIAHQLSDILKKELQKNVVKLKASELILDYSDNPQTSFNDKLHRFEILQDTGDKFRKDFQECGIIAAFFIDKIKKKREEFDSKEETVFILDSLKHPDEVSLLRSVYGDNFCLIGVSCNEKVRLQRLNDRKFLEIEDKNRILEFTQRDKEDSLNPFGQKVYKTFHLSDYFIDNSHDYDSKQSAVHESLKTMADVFFSTEVLRPKSHEMGMYYAFNAALRSSCLSRPVGAAIFDKNGTLLSVGTNDVPKAKGGLYDGSDPANDDRCFKNKKECSNTVWKLKVYDEIRKSLREAGLHETDLDSALLRKVIFQSRLGSLIEFSRSIHAEMDAILSLVRSGTKLSEGSTLFTTTYPCHSCARHIVASGIEKVVFLEPYKKSLALDLHSDSIIDESVENSADLDSSEKVKFQAYTGLSHRLYEKVFRWRGEIKDEETGKLMSPPTVVGSSLVLRDKSFIEHESKVSEYLETQLRKKQEEEEAHDGKKA